MQQLKLLLCQPKIEILREKSPSSAASDRTKFFYDCTIGGGMHVEIIVQTKQ